MWVELNDSSGSRIASGFTPTTFSVTSGAQYTVHAANWQNIVFNHWNDGNTSPSRIIVPTQTATLTAYYSTGSTTPTISLNPTTGAPGSIITVTGSNFQSNSAISISYDSTVVTTNPSTVTASSTGSFSATFTEPAPTAGSHTIMAKDAASNSASSQFTVIISTMSSAPQDLQASGGNARVSLSWQAPSSNGGSAITYYKIYKSTSSGTETYLTTRGNVTSWTDTGVTNGITYRSEEQRV